MEKRQTRAIGRPLRLDGVVMSNKVRVGQRDPFALTDREKQVYELRKTKSNKEVAEMLSITEKNARKMFENARDKVGVKR